MDLMDEIIIRFHLLVALFAALGYGFILLWLKRAKPPHDGVCGQLAGRGVCAVSRDGVDERTPSQPTHADGAISATATAKAPPQRIASAVTFIARVMRVVYFQAA